MQKQTTFQKYIFLQALVPSGPSEESESVATNVTSASLPSIQEEEAIPDLEGEIDTSVSSPNFPGPLMGSQAKRAAIDENDRIITPLYCPSPPSSRLRASFADRTTQK